MNQFARVAIIIFLMTACSQKIVHALSKNEFRQIQSEIKTLHRTGGADFAGAVVRLFFHDAAASPHAFNGCINLSSFPNVGVLKVHSHLEKIFNRFQQVISRSDLWALAASVVIMDSIPYGTHRGMDLIRDYKWGRVDTKCTGTDDKLPGPSGGIRTVMTEMAQRLKLSVPQVVALMGGHALGRADGSAGFHGEFTKDPGSFTNSYYKLMLNGKYQREGTNGGWREQETKTLLFSTDVCLAYNIEVPGCNINSHRGKCPTDANQFNTRKWVERFAVNTALWHGYFASAFIKISTGDNKLKALTDYPTTPLPRRTKMVTLDDVDIGYRNGKPMYIKRTGYYYKGRIQIKKYSSAFLKLVTYYKRLTKKKYTRHNSYPYIRHRHG